MATQLSAGQVQALKAHILANTATVLINGVATQIKDVPASPDNAAAIAAWYSLAASPAHYVWQTACPAESILDAIVWANMTPSDPVPTTPALTVDVYRARALVCQGKQFNLQNLILGRATINAAKPNIRAGLQDALTGYPSGAGGNVIAAGWAAVQHILSRQASHAEKLFAAGTGSQAVPATSAFPDGFALNHEDVLAALAS